MPNKFDSYDVVRFHQTDSETSQAQEFEGVVGGFSRTDSGDYVYQVYVAEKDAGYTIQERSLTRTGRVSPAEYRQIVAQRTAPALPLSTEGFVAHEPALVASSQSSHSATPSIRSSSIPSSNRYTALRGLVSLASIFAQLSVVAGIIGVVGGLIATGTPFVGGLGWIIVLLCLCRSHLLLHLSGCSREYSGSLGYGE